MDLKPKTNGYILYSYGDCDIGPAYKIQRLDKILDRTTSDQIAYRGNFTGKFLLFI